MSEPVTSSSSPNPFDLFELCAALLLGIGAIGTALAGHQNGLWGGQSLEAYSEAASMNTKASATFNDELSIYLQDVQTDIRAKEHIWEGLESEDSDRKERLLAMGSWLYLSQVSDAAFGTLGLPQEPRTLYFDKQEDHIFTEQELDLALNTELDDESYQNAIFSDSADEFEAADAKFAQGQVANKNGDYFSFATVVLALGMFFSGISLVFKSQVRWGFLATGALISLGGIGYMVTLPWTS